MARPVGEAISYLAHRYVEPFVWTLACGAVAIGAMTYTEDQILEPAAKLFADIPLHRLGIVPPWENDHNKIDTVEKGGQLTLDSYLGAFVNFTQARTSFKSEILGQTVSDSHTAREGYIVSRIKLPGVPTLDWRSDDDVMYLTRFQDGQDTGISIDKAIFEMQNPETASIQDGKFQCRKKIGDIDYTGCVESDTIRSGFLAYFPIIGEDQGDNLEIAGELLFDEFAKIEQCHFDNIFIPAFNQIYEANHINKRIDGPDQYTEAMKTFIRYFIRASIADQTPAQRVFPNLTGNYVPTPSIITRMAERGKAVDFPFQLGSDIEPNYCAKDTNGNVPISVVGGTTLDADLLKIAIGGLEVVPAGFNIQTGVFEPGKFAAADLSTSLGDTIKSKFTEGG